MARAFIMVKAAVGRSPPLLDTVRGMEHVVEANIVAGDFDLVVEAEADEMSDLINAVATKIRGFDDVEDTKTYVCLE